MKNLKITIFATLIATSTLFTSFTSNVFAEEEAEEATVTINKIATFTVTGDIPPIDAHTNLPIEMTAAPIELEENTLYEVVEGDTLTKIAAMFSLDVETLMIWNHLPNDFLQIGQVLSIDGQVELTEEQLAAMEAAKLAEKDSKNKQNSQAANPPSTSNTSGLLDIAYQYLGVPYVFGGTTPSGFDCSGYISYVFMKAGKLDAHYNAEGLYTISQKVSNPQVGDLVFFSGTYKSGISHVGIYIGDNQMINASGKKVQISNIYDSYWGKHFTGFGRI